MEYESTTNIFIHPFTRPSLGLRIHNAARVPAVFTVYVYSEQTERFTPRQMIVGQRFPHFYTHHMIHSHSFLVNLASQRGCHRITAHMGRVRWVCAAVTALRPDGTGVFAHTTLCTKREVTRVSFKAIWSHSGFYSSWWFISAQSEHSLQGFRGGLQTRVTCTLHLVTFTHTHLYTINLSSSEHYRL